MATSIVCDEDIPNPIKLKTLTSGSWESDETASESESMALSDAERLSPTASVDEYRGPFNLDEVDHLYEEEKILDAARLLLKMEHRDKLPEKYRSIIDLAEEFENAIADITGPPDESSDWTKQGEHQGKWPTLLYNKFDEEVRLSVRIETPIEASLLVPLLSVLNETDAYDTWMPSFKLPKAGLQESNQLECAGRADQTVQLLFDLPWPLAKKEVIIHAVAVDEIDTQQYIVVRLNTLKEGHPVVPPLAKGVDRVDFNGAILFRACPPDHELLANHTSDEPLVLVSFKMDFDTSFKKVPKAILNFFTRTLLSRIWSKLLQVADDVRHGKRPQHAAAIEEKQDLYKWVEERSNVMLESLQG